LCAPRTRAPCVRARYYDVRLVTPCAAALCVGSRREPRGPELACELFRPARAPSASTHCAHRHVGRAKYCAPSSAPRKRAPFARGRHRAALIAAPCAAVWCAGSRRGPRGQSLFANSPRSACAQYMDALCPLPRGSRHVSRTVVCATSTRTVCRLRALCSACRHVVRRRAVRRVAWQANRRANLTCRGFRARANCRVGRPQLRTPLCAPRARAPCARCGHCTVHAAMPCATVRCAASCGKPAAEQNRPAEFPRARPVRPVRRRVAPAVAWVAPGIAHRCVRPEHAHRVHAAGTVPCMPPCRAPP
jgi:hypothetical protein